jgi:two-component system NarL family sensor kinase
MTGTLRPAAARAAGSAVPPAVLGRVPTTKDADPGTAGRCRADTSGVTLAPASFAVPRIRVTTAPAVVLGLALVAVLGGLALDLANTPADRDRAMMGLGGVTGCVGLLLVGCAAAILYRFPRHRVAWVMAVTGLVWAYDGLAEAWSARGMAETPYLPLTGFAVWFVAQFCAVLMSGLPLVLVLYPDGRLLPGRWRYAGIACVTMSLLLAVALWFAPMSALAAETPLPMTTGMPQLPIGDDAYIAILTGCRVLTLLSLPLAVVLVFVRQRRATGVQRLQLRWLAWAAVMCAIFGVVSQLAPTGGLATAGLILCLAVTGVSVAIGILDPEVTDVDALMGGTLVYAAVVGAVIGLDLALVALLNAVMGERLDEREATLFVLLLAVAAYGPLRAWLGKVIRRLLVGRRGDRYDVVSSLAARLEESADVETQLPAFAAAVAATFKLGFVRVEVFGHAGGIISATHGEEPSATREVPIRYGPDEVGRLILPDRGIRSMLSHRDQELLFDVVRQAAMAVRSSRLAEQLQASREQLVLDREEDRRRIRRDLHDGLGPVLGGVAMRLDAAGNALETEPETARQMVLRSRQDITEALADVRRLVHGLRPPALDDLGLLDALRQQVERTRSPHLDVDIEAAALPTLPAAVEVAAYRIASEGLANTVRHADATRATLRLVGQPGQLLVEIADDGRGIDPAVPAGVGLRSIRERAEELGGRTEIVCPAAGGTRVRAWLPVSTIPEERTS